MITNKYKAVLIFIFARPVNAISIKIQKPYKRNCSLIFYQCLIIFNAVVAIFFPVSAMFS